VTLKTQGVAVGLAPGWIQPLSFENFAMENTEIYPLVMTNSSPWFFDGPNRNRWFTVLNSMVDLSMAMLVITRW
jgi:hypothetical protein